MKIKYSNPKRHILGAKHVTKRRMVTIHPPARLVGEAKKRKKKRRKTPKTVANWLFAQTTHVVVSKSNFTWWVVCDV